MKNSATVSEIMTKNVITLSTKNNLEDAESLFKKNKIRHIPVVSGEEIIGMLSYTDLLRVSYVDSVDEDDVNIESILYNMFSITQVMTKDIVSVDANTTIKEVAEILAKNEFHALPVISDDKLVGIVTTTDLINYLIKQI